MAVERFTSLSAGVLADRADRELAEIMEALGLEGSNAGAALGAVRGMLAEAVRASAQAERRAKRLRRQVAEYEYYQGLYEGEAFYARDDLRERIAALARARSALARGDSAACEEGLAALDAALVGDLADAEAQFPEPTEDDLVSHLWALDYLVPVEYGGDGELGDGDADGLGAAMADLISSVEVAREHVAAAGLSVDRLVVACKGAAPDLQVLAREVVDELRAAWEAMPRREVVFTRTAHDDGSVAWDVGRSIVAGPDLDGARFGVLPNEGVVASGQCGRRDARLRPAGALGQGVGDE